MPTRALFLALALTTLHAADTDHLKLIPKRMQTYVDSGAISGAITLVAHHGQILELDAVGYADVENKKPMRTDTIVQIMSQTKSFTGVAAMILVEEGLLDPTRPVQDYLPEFKGQLAEEKRPDGTVTTHKPEHPPTVWQIMCHSAGFPFLPPDGPYKRINFTLDATLAEAVKGYATAHMINEPGRKYLYSNMGIATLGRIVEVLSGMEYPQFLKARILDPLGMKDTFFFPTDDKKPRIAMVYQHDDGKLSLSHDRAQAGDPANYRAGAKYAGPELGLYSTATDLAHFYQMLANGGTYNGHRILSKQSVQAMTHAVSPVNPGYGLTLQVMDNPHALLNLVSPGTFGHGGAFGTGGWVDPKTDLVMVFLAQMNDGTANTPKNAFWQMAESTVQ
ncbi:MAG TPA: serine hydrolase domain-containing protein [Bryobacteraceae bacterium]|jgi:CubicO group peptidase (beta-lactamase class C family)